MRRIRARTLVILTALGLLVGLMQLMGVSPASAQGNGLVELPSPLCDTSGWCMNDWYGGLANNPVRYFEPLASSNEDLEVVDINRCGGFVTENCPFTDVGLDEEFYLNPVVEIYDTANGFCVSASANATAVLGTCPNSSGEGGSPGNVFVYQSYNITGSDVLYSNKYTNADSDPVCIGSSNGEYDGATIYLNESGSDCSSWDQ